MKVIIQYFVDVGTHMHVVYICFNNEQESKNKESELNHSVCMSNRHRLLNKEHKFCHKMGLCLFSPLSKYSFRPHIVRKISHLTLLPTVHE